MLKLHLFLNDKSSFAALDNGFEYSKNIVLFMVNDYRHSKLSNLICIIFSLGAISLEPVNKTNKISFWYFILFIYF